MTNISLVIITLSILLSACEKDNLTPQPVGELDAELGIEAVPSSLGNSYTGNFNRSTKVITPNGGFIHIVAQSNISNEQIVRCRSILAHFLTDYEGSLFGFDKSAIANKMVENGAILILLNGQDDGSNELEVNGQALFENEIQVEGHQWYVNQDYKHRDAAYEEILHLVHDYGIGVDGANSSSGSAPEFQNEIRAAQTNALANNLWGIDASEWIAELTNENSLSQEYLAAVIDVYYGLWGAWSESTTHGMLGLYVAKTRDDILTKDPMGKELMNNKFFHPYLTYNARIDSSFTGNFYMRFNETVSYTHHSRYLKDITLLGNNDINVVVNEWDNDITGNTGVNTVIFSGNYAEYTIITSDGITTITDNTTNSDGTNRVREVEKLKFVDHVINL